MIHLTLVWSELSSHPNYLDLVDSVWCFFGPFYKYAPRVDFLLVWLVWLWLTRVIHSSKLLAPLACHLLSCNTATNTFYNLGKYILQFEQIHFAIWTNTFCNLNKCIVERVGWRSTLLPELAGARALWPLLAANYQLSRMYCLLLYNTHIFQGIHFKRYTRSQNVLIILGKP